MFVLNRFNWQPGATGYVRLPGEFRIATFATAEEAHAERQRLEEAAQRLINPFEGGPAPAEQSNLPEPILCDWLRDHGIEPPAPDKRTGARDWAKWWKKAAKKWTPEKRTAAWEALDRMRFFEVVEEPEREIAYLVAEADEHYSEAHYVYVRGAYRSREHSDRDCSDRNADVLDPEAHGPEDDPKRRDPLAPFRWGSHVGFDFEDRPVGTWPNGRWFYLTVPLEIDGRPKGQLYVVVRVIYRYIDNDCFRSPMEAGDALSFVRGFSSRKAAEMYQRQKVQQARECVAPGRIQSHVQPEKFVKGIRKLGLPPPDPEELENDSSLLMPWWASVAANATREQRAAVWELLSDVALYVVLKTKLKD
jgi:hypothetical protein